MLLVPTVIASWFTISYFALLRQRNNGDMLVNGGDYQHIAFPIKMDGLPIGAITSVLAVLVIVFFLRYVVGPLLVIDILSAGGDAGPA